MNRLLLGGALLALVLAALLWSTSADTPAAAVVAQDASIETVVAPTIATPTEVAPDRETVAEPVADAESLVGAGSIGALVLRGTLLVIDDQGAERSDLDGELGLGLWQGVSAEHRTLEVRGGMWSTTLSSESPIEALSLELIVADGRRALPLAQLQGHFPLPADLKLAVSARWLPDSLLHVRDRNSGAELDPVLVVFAEGWPDTDFFHPCEAAPHAIDKGPSPLQFPAGRDESTSERTLFAGSPGYAWGKIQIDPKKGGEHILLLERGGDLDINVLGPIDEPNAVVRLFGKEFDPIFELPLGKRSLIQVAALVPGEYRLCAQIGDFWKEPLDLGEVQVLIVAGQRSSVVLTLKEFVAPTRVPCAGTLMIPAAWDLEDFTLSFSLIGNALGGDDGRFEVERAQMQSLDEPPTLYTWKATNVQPGRYEAEIWALAFNVVLDVPLQGIFDARIVVPPPTWVEVRCVDDATGIRLEEASVDWRFKVPEGVDGWSLLEAEWNQESECFRFRAPIGTVLIDGECPGFVSVWDEFEVGPGPNKIELRLGRVCRLKLILRDGESLIPWVGGRPPRLMPEAGQSDYNAWSTDGESIVVLCGAPGPFTLKIPQIAGFEPVPDQLVRLEKEVLVEHVVQLVRTR